MSVVTIIRRLQDSDVQAKPYDDGSRQGIVAPLCHDQAVSAVLEEEGQAVEVLDMGPEENCLLYRFLGIIRLA